MYVARDSTLSDGTRMGALHDLSQKILAKILKTFYILLSSLYVTP